MGSLNFPCSTVTSDELVGKRRPLPVGDERMKQRQAILAARHTNRNPVVRPQHLEPPHGTAHQIENSLLRFHYSLLARNRGPQCPLVQPDLYRRVQFYGFRTADHFSLAA